MVMRRLASGLLCFDCLVPLALAADEGLNPQDLLKPLSSDWPTFNGDYSGKRYSKLAQINQSNVRKLTLCMGLAAAIGRDQIDAARSERNPLLHDAGQRLGRRRANGRTDLALLSPVDRRPYRAARRGNV